MEPAEPRVASLGPDAPVDVVVAAICGAADDREVPVRACPDGVLHGAGAATAVPLRRMVAAWRRAGEVSPATAPAADARYLAQCPVDAFFPDAVPAVMALWQAAAPALRLATHAAPAFHVWMNVEGATSATHFDDDDGVLVVLAGEKRVVLAPPRLHDPLLAHPVWSTEYHHAVGGSVPPPDALRWHGSPITLRAGDALLIPAGYWHHVVSAPGTLAVNAWLPPADAAAVVCVRKGLRALTEQRLDAARGADAAAARGRLREGGWEAPLSLVDDGERAEEASRGIVDRWVAECGSWSDATVSRPCCGRGLHCAPV
jgi:hypothetical protein